jgi:hypothetical protein
MTVTLNRRAVEHARRLIREGRFVSDGRDAWSEHQPSAEEENELIREHGFTEYSKWHLGIATDEPEETKAHHRFPFGDFVRVHRCGLLAAESRAGQYGHLDIEKAAHQLHEAIDAAKGERHANR